MGGKQPTNFLIGLSLLSLDKMEFRMANLLRKKPINVNITVFMELKQKSFGACMIRDLYSCCSPVERFGKRQQKIEKKAYSTEYIRS